MGVDTLPVACVGEGGREGESESDNPHEELNSARSATVHPALSGRPNYEVDLGMKLPGVGQAVLWDGVLLLPA